MIRSRRALALLWLPALLGLQQCGSSRSNKPNEGSGGDPSLAGAFSDEPSSAGSGSSKGGSKGVSENCRLVEKCCPRLAGDDRQACEGIAMIRDELGCTALLAIHPECKTGGLGGSPSGGASSVAGSGGGGAVSSVGGEPSGGGNGSSGAASGSGGNRTDGLRNYSCGYAQAGVSGLPCENGRSTGYVAAKDMTAAIAACVYAQPADRAYLCCVLDGDGAAPTDESECLAAPPLGPSRLAPAWRPGRSCCRFEGETTCPPL